MPEAALPNHRKAVFDHVLPHMRRDIGQIDETLGQPIRTRRRRHRQHGEEEDRRTHCHAHQVPVRMILIRTSRMTAPIAE